MKTVYQVQSRLSNREWMDDHMPFDSKEQAIDYIHTQPRCFQYRILEDEIFESAAEELAFHDAMDAIGGDWEG